VILFLFLFYTHLFFPAVSVPFGSSKDVSNVYYYIIHIIIHDCRGRVRIIHARPTISLFRLRDYTTTVTIKKITRIGNYIYNNNDNNNNNNNNIIRSGAASKVYYNTGGEASWTKFVCV
jgi:hypothetical protein